MVKTFTLVLPHFPFGACYGLILFYVGKGRQLEFDVYLQPVAFDLGRRDRIRYADMQDCPASKFMEEGFGRPVRRYAHVCLGLSLLVRVSLKLPIAVEFIPYCSISRNTPRTPGFDLLILSSPSFGGVLGYTWHIW